MATGKCNSDDDENEDNEAKDRLILSVCLVWKELKMERKGGIAIEYSIS